MRYSVRLNDQAAEDLDDIVFFIARGNPSAAEKLGLSRAGRNGVQFSDIPLSGTTDEIATKSPETSLNALVLEEAVVGRLLSAIHLQPRCFSEQFNARGELGTECRALYLALRCKKSDLTIPIVYPHFAGASGKVQSAFLIDLGLGIRRGEDLHTDIGCG